MSISESALIASLQTSLPQDVLVELLKEYKHIKQQFFLSKFRPTELNAGRFAECMLRILEFVDSNSYTPFGSQLDSEKIINRLPNNVSLPNTLRFFIPRLIRVILDVRNKRDVAHVGGEVNPNYSDSIFVIHAVDWILTELVRHYHSCPIDQAAAIVSTINEIQIPIIDEFEGFIRVLDTSLKTSDKVLVILYSKQPNKISEQELRKWVEYKNSTNFRDKVLFALHKEAFIHYDNSFCSLTRKGILYVEKNIPSNILLV
ncbi:MAG: hypothetical protein KA314_03945 [Chloroflexi bacterium]|nr:hypothetical protein [Chloroflexota bacterium]MBP8054963.1 hypothetical protein [Chloroflexota bacterium]